MWDVTCVNTSSTIIINCTTAIRAAALAPEEHSCWCYATLSLRYNFMPLAVKTSGVLGPAFNDLLQNISNSTR